MGYGNDAFKTMNFPARYDFKGTFAGGVRPNTDVLDRANPATLLDAKNIVSTKPVGYLNSSALSRNAVTTVPPTYFFNGGDVYVNSGFHYPSPIHTKSIATFESADWPSESWSFSGTGTASLIAAISEGDECLSCACTASQTATGTGTVASVNLSSPTYGILAVDTQWNNVSNFSSGYIRIGSDASNYRQYDLTAPSGAGQFILKFTLASPSSTTGTPTMTAIDYVQISLTASGGGAITVLFDNLRLGSFSSASSASLALVANATNIYNSFILDSTYGATSASVSVFSNSLFSGRTAIVDSTAGFDSVMVKTGFTNTQSYNFYFSQFPKSGSATNNILYYVNGTDGYFSYDPSASAGSKNSRISSVAYSYVCSHKNIMFLAGASATPNTVQPSDINDPTTLTGANAVVVPNVSGSYVTGLISMDEYLAILRNDGIYLLYGSDPATASTDFQLIRSKSKIGCIEQKAACRVGPYIYFFSGNGIYRFDGNDSELISEGLENFLDGYHSKLCAMYYNPIRECVVFQYSPSTVPDPVTTPANHYELYYYPKLNAWGHSGGISDASSVKFFGLSWGGSLYSKPLVFEGGLQFYQLDPTTNTTYSMAWSATTAWNDCGSPNDDKDFAELTIYIREFASLSLPSVNIDVYTNYDTSTVAQTFTAVTPNSDNMIFVGLSDVVGTAIAFKISGTCADQKTNAVILSGYRGLFTYSGAT
jgi:hypothetical protein